MTEKRKLCFSYEIYVESFKEHLIKKKSLKYHS